MSGNNFFLGLTSILPSYSLVQSAVFYFLMYRSISNIRRDIMALTAMTCSNIDELSLGACGLLLYVFIGFQKQNFKIALLFLIQFLVLLPCINLSVYNEMETRFH